MNSNQYDDISIFESFANNVQQEHERQMEGAQRDGDPIFYLDTKNRTYKMRFYPEIVDDPNTGRPTILVTRTVWSHSGFDKLPRLPCKGKGCPICAEVARLKEAKYKEVWRHSARKEAIARGYIFEANTPSDYKYLKTQEYGFIVMRDKAYQSLTAFLADLNPEDLRKVLNPRIEAPRIKLILTPGSDGSASWGFDIHPAELPPLPEGFKSVNEVYVKEDDPITDEQMRDIRKQVNKILMSLGAGQLMEPDDYEAPADTPRQSAQDAVSAALGASAAPASNSASTAAAPACPGTKEGLEFGKNPQVLSGAVSPTCLACPYEDECMAATHKE